MSATVASSSHSRRRAWLAVLARAPRADLEAALARAFEGAELPAYEWLRAPEIGLAMVRGRIGGTGDPFNLGEATVTRATLRLKGVSGGDGMAPVGVACQLGRDKRRAELAALADALLQVPERHADLNERLIEPLAERLSAQRETRRQDAASTRVEFFTMVRGD